MTSLKVGDRIVYESRLLGEAKRGVVTEIDWNSLFSIQVKYDDGGTNGVRPGPWIMPEEIYDSPLYKALK